jgi:hypothetical protein
LRECWGDGLHAVHDGRANGNALYLAGTSLSGNRGHGLVFDAVKADIIGCQIERNKQSGIQLLSRSMGVNISAYCEANQTCQIELVSQLGRVLSGVHVAGCFCNSWEFSTPSILKTGDGVIENIVIAESNHYIQRPGVPPIAL